MTSWQILEGDCRAVLAGLDAGCVQTCVTSPPYFGLRDYGTGSWEGGDPSCGHTKVRDHSAAVASSTLGGGKKTPGHVQEGFGATCGRCGASRVDRQIGLEPTPDEFVAALVAVFREVRRVLRDDGTVWLNLGDSYAAGKQGRSDHGTGDPTSRLGPLRDGLPTATAVAGATAQRPAPDGMKPKDLIGIPWMVAFALRADGWYLRSEIVWAKPNPMPESVTDRPTKAHEQVFLLSKRPRYFYDADAIKEAPHQPSRGKVGQARHTTMADHPKSHAEVCRYCAGSGEAHDPHAGEGPVCPECDGSGDARKRSNRPEYRPSLSNPTSRNRRSVWTVATQPYAGAHFATFPPKLIEPCILAGAPAGATVLDPFAGAGTTGLVALRHDRSFIGIELNPAYAALARDRIRDDAPLLNSHAEIAA